MTWLDRRGLIAIAGPSGSGKTTALASLVAALGARSRRVVALEDPIEILQSPATTWISQRAIGAHVPSFVAGVAAAMHESADAILIGAVSGADAAAAVVDALAGGHLGPDDGRRVLGRGRPRPHPRAPAQRPPAPRPDHPRARPARHDRHRDRPRRPSRLRGRVGAAGVSPLEIARISRLPAPGPGTIILGRGFHLPATSQAI